MVDFGILDQAPRASFDGVEAQVFPLFADGRQLSTFLDEYFNATIPPEISVVRPLAPLVFLTALYYPRIHGAFEEEAAALRQHEYYFLVPVGRFERRNGHEVLVETGVVTPYIYVDDPVSVSLGREVYGWQKRLFRVSHVDPSGANLSKPQPYMEVERPTPGRDGRSLAYRPQMRIYQTGEAQPYNPVHDFTHTSRHALRDLDPIIRAAFPGPNGSLGGLSAERRFNMLTDVGRKILGPDGGLDVFLLVQFPHASRVYDGPRHRYFSASYTGFTHARMGLRCIRQFAQLGHGPPWTRDTSRGFTIHFMGQGVENIPSRLGLQVDRHDEDHDGCAVQVVRPFLPFVAGFDLRIDKLRTLARRGTHTDWLDEHSRPLVRRPTEDAAALYNTYLGASSAQGFKSYGKSKQTVRFKALGLLADLEKLKATIADLAPTPPELSIVPRKLDDRGVVITMVDNIRQDPDSRDELVWFSGTFLCFVVLCDVTYQGRCRTAFVEVLGFSDNPHAVLVGRELLAANRLLAEFDGSPYPWFPPQPANDADPGPDPEDEAAAHRRHVMRMQTSVLPTRNAGDRIRDLPLLDIFECTHDAHLEHSHPEVDGLDRLGMVFGDEGSLVPLIRVDAIPTTKDGELDTAVVRIHVEEVELGVKQPAPEIGSYALAPHQVRFHRHASMRIVERLGLVATPEDALDTDMCSTALAVAGRFDGVTRNVETLFEWNGQSGWQEELGLATFFDPRCCREVDSE